MRKRKGVSPSEEPFLNRLSVMEFLKFNNCPPDRWERFYSIPIEIGKATEGKKRVLLRAVSFFSPFANRQRSQRHVTKRKENDRAPRFTRIDESMERNHPPTRNLIESFVDTCRSSKPVGKTAMFEMSWSGERRGAISQGKKHATTRITCGIPSHFSVIL